MISAFTASGAPCSSFVTTFSWFEHLRQTTRPHPRQWCRRFVIPKLILQMGHSSAFSSGCQTIISFVRLVSLLFAQGQFARGYHHTIDIVNEVLADELNRRIDTLASPLFRESRIHSLFLLCTRDTLTSVIHSLFTYLYLGYTRKASGYTRPNID